MSTAFRPKVGTFVAEGGGGSSLRVRVLKRLLKRGVTGDREGVSQIKELARITRICLYTEAARTMSLVEAITKAVTRYQ
jgi:hypothetical protein